MAVLNRSKNAISRTAAAVIVIVIIVIAGVVAAYYVSTSAPASTSTVVSTAVSTSIATSVSTSTVVSTSTIVSVSTPTSTSTGMKEFKILMFTSNGEATPWGQAVIVGLKAAIAKLNNTNGYTLRLATVWEATQANFGSIMDSYIAQGYNLIIDQDVSGTSALDSTAPKYPNTQFLGLVADTGPNYGTTELDYWKCDYMRGVVAGLATKSNLLGFVTAFQFSTTTEALNAFLAGARLVNPNAKVVYTYAGTWTDPVKGASAGKSLVALGADVLVGWGDGMTDGVISAAQSAGVPAMGYIHDASSLAPKTVLTSVLANFTQYFYRSIPAAEAGQIGYKTYALNIYPDHVCYLAPIQNLPPDVVAQANSYIQKISTGQLVPPVNDTLPAQGK